MEQIKDLIIKFRKSPLYDTFLFIVIILAFHLFFRAWANWFHFWPIYDLTMQLQNSLATQVFEQSVWFNRHILGLEMVINEQSMFFPGHGYITINASCSGFKQFLQFIVLMLVYPGPWKHKTWFIPVGVFIVHLTNLFRIVGLSVVTINWPEYWQFSHDNIFRPFFYVVMFFMWVLWVEKFRKKS